MTAARPEDADNQLFHTGSRSRRNGLDRRGRRSRLTAEPLTRQEERPGRAEALEIGGAALLELEFAPGQLAERLAHLDAAGQAVRLHARGEVHRIAPHVVGE